MNDRHGSGVRAGLLLLCGTLAACAGPSVIAVPHPGDSLQAPSSALRKLGAVKRADGEIDVTLMYGARIPIEFQTQPGASCRSGASKPGHEVYADATGAVRMGMRAKKPRAAESAFVITCSLNGRVVASVPIRVTQLAGTAPSATAAPIARTFATQADVAAAKTRLGFDFTTASRDELIAHDLPPRPDLPDGYADWLRVVTSPTVRVIRQGVPIPRYHQAYSDSRNWSGYAVTGANYTYSTASGEWYVPSIPNPADCGDYCYAAVWPGIGGYVAGDGSVIQDGTESYTYPDMCSDTGCYDDVDGFYLWYEYYPGGSHGAFAVAANDDVWCEAWASSPSSSSSGGGFYCKDNTTGWVLSTSLGKPTNGTFYGASAEWVLETPLLPGGYAVLPDYGNAYMWGAYGALTSNGSWFGYSQEYTTNITMYNTKDGHTLSTAAPWSGKGYGIEWTWENYD